MESKLNLDDLVKTERQFLKENKAEKNEKDVYVFTSENGYEHISLDFYLKEYKDWLVEKGIIKIL